MRRWLWALVAGLLLTCGARGVRADAADDAAVAEARSLFGQGNDRLDVGDYVGALDLFRAALRKWDNPKILLNIGTALRQLGRLPEAADSYDRYLAHRDADPKRTAEVQGILRDLNGRLGRLEIQVNEAGARVLVDGREVGASPLAMTLRVDPGSHTVVAEKAGFAAAVATVTAEAGMLRHVDLRMNPASDDEDDDDDDGGDGDGDSNLGAGAPPPLTPETTERTLPWHQDTWGWVITGAGVLVAGVGVGLLVSASGLNDDGDAEGDPIKARDLYDRADDRKLQGGLTLGAGAAIAIAGVIKLAWPNRQRVPAQRQVRLGPGGITVVLKF